MTLIDIRLTWLGWALRRLRVTTAPLSLLNLRLVGSTRRRKKAGEIDRKNRNAVGNPERHLPVTRLN